MRYLPPLQIGPNLISDEVKLWNGFKLVTGQRILLHKQYYTYMGRDWGSQALIFLGTSGDYYHIAATEFAIRLSNGEVCLDKKPRNVNRQREEINNEPTRDIEAGAICYLNGVEVMYVGRTEDHLSVIQFYINGIVYCLGISAYQLYQIWEGHLHAFSIEDLVSYTTEA